MNITVPVNYLSVLAAAVVSMVLGWLWYGPLFGKMWSRETKMKMETKNMGMSYGLMFLGSLVMAYVLSHAIIFAGTYLQMTGAPAGLMSGFFNWIGFVAPVTLGSVLWEKKSWKLWILNNGYYLITLLAMGYLLAVWQ